MYLAYEDFKKQRHLVDRYHRLRTDFVVVEEFFHGHQREAISSSLGCSVAGIDGHIFNTTLVKKRQILFRFPGVRGLMINFVKSIYEPSQVPSSHSSQHPQILFRFLSHGLSSIQAQGWHKRDQGCNEAPCMTLRGEMQISGLEVRAATISIVGRDTSLEV